MLSYVSSTAYMFQAILAGLLISLTACWLAIRVARRLDLIDIPGSSPHKQHEFPTPLAGGMALMISLIILVMVFGLFVDSELLPVLLASAVIFAFGLWDDAYGMSAPVKVLGQTIAVVILIASGLHIRIFEYPGFFIGGSGPFYRALNWAVTWFWVVGITNAFNLTDSMDGLSVGLSGWALAFFTLATFDSGQISLSLFCALLLGICLGISYYNRHPAKLFLGDSGAQTLGFFLAVIGMFYTPVGAYQTSSWFVPILLVGVPIFDTSLVFFSRLRRKQAFYKSGRDHTYHRLVKRGMDSGRAVMAMHFAALILECVAFVAVSLEPFQANGLFIFCILAGVVLFFMLDRKSL
jgi:UDP-GlcNAc:undecaprenyl-phosphate/decaprenyl-phosphate GlcNAc-1-phosphate transferase